MKQDATRSRRPVRRSASPWLRVFCWDADLSLLSQGGDPLFGYRIRFYGLVIPWTEIAIGVFVRERPSHVIAKPFGLCTVEDWQGRRNTTEDRDLCPCDGHPVCKTCELACSCHWGRIGCPCPKFVPKVAAIPESTPEKDPRE